MHPIPDAKIDISHRERLRLGFGSEFPSSANRMQTLQSGTGSLQSVLPGKPIRLHFLR